MEASGLSSLQKRVLAALSYHSAPVYNHKMHEFKSELFGDLRRFTSADGTLRLLEIGCGSGANFGYFPRGCTVLCTDPNPHCDPYLRRNVHEHPHVCFEDFLVTSAERLERVQDASVDVVVCTLVLCSVRNVRQVLQEVRRVLRAGGALFFLEHVASDPSSWGLYHLQCVLDPLWSCLGEGCSLTRTTWTDLEEADFSELHLQHISAPKVSAVIRPHIMGHCVK